MTERHRVRIKYRKEEADERGTETLSESQSEKHRQRGTVRLRVSS